MMMVFNDCCGRGGNLFSMVSLLVMLTKCLQLSRSAEMALVVSGVGVPIGG